MTLSTLEVRILELARHTLLRRAIMDQCKLAGASALEVTHALGGLVGSGLIEHAYDGPTSAKDTTPIRYTTTRRGLEQLDRQPRAHAGVR